MLCSKILRSLLCDKVIFEGGPTEGNRADRLWFGFESRRDKACDYPAREFKDLCLANLGLWCCRDATADNAKEIRAIWKDSFAG